MPSDVKWIKLSTSLPDSKKIKQIRKLPNGDAIALMWIFLMCLAGETNDNGMVYFTPEIPFTEEMLSSQFSIDINTVRLGLQTFQRFGMIEIVNDIICLSQWEKWQEADKLSVIREQTRQRVARHRDRQRIAASSVSSDAPSCSNSCNATCNVTVTECNATEQELKQDINNNKINAHARAREESSSFKSFGEELTEEDVTASLNLAQWIEDLAFKWGLPKNPGNLQQALDIYREFEDCPKDWFETAVERAGSKDATKSWNYVRGVLRNAILCPNVCWI